MRIGDDVWGCGDGASVCGCSVGVLEVIDACGYTDGVRVGAVVCGLSVGVLEGLDVFGWVDGMRVGDDV